MPAIVKPCTCDSTFQDQIYGKKNRVHSVSDDGKKTRCSVCGKENK